MEHTIRWKNNTTKTITLTKSSAIKHFCYECQGFSNSDCDSPMCPFYPFKMKTYKTGRTGRVMSEEHKAKIIAARRKQNVSVA